MNGIMNIGLQGLAAYEMALQTTSNNIANVDTPNYDRRQVNFTENIIGSGVSIANVQRIYDTTMDQNVLSTNSNLSSASTSLQKLQYFESLMDAKNSPVLQNLTNSLQALTQLDSAAGSIDKRTYYLNQLQLLVQQMNTLSTQITNEQNTVNQNLVASAANLNNILQGISSINGQLGNASSDAQASLLDNQSTLLNQLSQYLNFTTQTNSDGSVNLFLQNGTSLVLGTSTYAFGTMQDPVDSAKTALYISANSSNVLVDSVITSGSIGSLLNYRDQTLAGANNALGQLSLAFAQIFNAQNQLGLDLNGNLGGNIFNDINNNLVLQTGRAVANATNTGTEGTTSMNVTITNVSVLPTNDYTLSFTSPTTYVLINQANGTSIGGTLSGSYPQTITSADGFNINLTSGGYATGDSFLISPTRGAIGNFGLAISDPKLLALASPVALTQGTQNTGSAALAQGGIVVTDTTNSAFSLLQQSPPTYALNPPVTIQFTSATTYNILDQTTGNPIASNLTYTAGQPVIPATGYSPGYSITMQGVPAAGDSFDVNYNTNRNDNKNGVVMESLYTKNDMQNNTVNFSTAYITLANTVSGTASNIKAQYSSAQTLNDAAVKQQQDLSGVSIPEETSSLAMYQQSYQACAQVLQVAKTIFESFLSVMTR